LSNRPGGGGEELVTVMMGTVFSHETGKEEGKKESAQVGRASLEKLRKKHNPREGEEGKERNGQAEKEKCRSKFTRKTPGLGIITQPFTWGRLSGGERTIII